jgi:hypothetical protein
VNAAKVFAWIEPQPSGCWLWTGATTTGNGGHLYGCLRTDGGTERAHRFVWELVRGPIPEGMVLHHRCGAKLCVCPDHLEPADPREHLREHNLTDTCAAGHPWDESNTSWIRDGSRIKRRCRICNRLYWQARRAAMRSALGDAQES